MNCTLSIARTAFRISSALDMYYPDEAGPMAEFSGMPSPLSDINISVDILIGGSADFTTMKIVAEAESAWKLLDDGESRWFVSCFDLPDGKPAWAARMNKNCSCITVEYYSAVSSETGRVPSPILYPLDQLLLIHVLASRRGLLIHGTGLRKGNDVIVLAGVSGAGKTTLSELIDGADDLEILSDDRVFIREQDGRYMVYGTPWPGEGGFAMNEGGELKNLCFLKQGEANELKPLDAKTAFERMMPVASVPWYDEELMSSAIDFAGAVVGGVPCCDFIFRKDKSVLDLIGEIL